MTTVAVVRKKQVHKHFAPKPVACNQNDGHGPNEHRIGTAKCLQLAARICRQRYNVAFWSRIQMRGCAFDVCQTCRSSGKEHQTGFMISH